MIHKKLKKGAWNEVDGIVRECIEDTCTGCTTTARMVAITLTKLTQDWQARLYRRMRNDTLN